jgi:hypothetical protein
MDRRASGVGPRFWFQVVFSAAAIVLMILSLIGRDWIEVFTGWDPDRGSGAFEWLVVAVLGLVAIGFGVAARAGWQRRWQGQRTARGSDDA